MFGEVARGPLRSDASVTGQNPSRAIEQYRVIRLASRRAGSAERTGTRRARHRLRPDSGAPVSRPRESPLRAPVRPPRAAPLQAAGAAGLARFSELRVERCPEMDLCQTRLAAHQRIDRVVVVRARVLWPLPRRVEPDHLVAVVVVVARVGHDGERGHECSTARRQSIRARSRARPSTASARQARRPPRSRPVAGTSAARPRLQYNRHHARRRRENRENQIPRNANGAGARRGNVIARAP